MAALIGIFGGTFNPIHFGHLRLAEEVANTLDCDHIRFIPSAHPPHKPPPTVSAAHRAKMVEIAIADNPRFKLDTCELHREGPSYTVDTLTALKQQFPQHHLCLLMGVDAFSQLNTWHRWQQLFELTHIVLVERPKQAQNKLHPALANTWLQRRTPLHTAIDAMRNQDAGIITEISTTPLAISSTEIRNAFFQQQSARYLLPNDVMTWIQSHQLYQT